MGNYWAIKSDNYLYAFYASRNIIIYITSYQNSIFIFGHINNTFLQCTRLYKVNKPEISFELSQISETVFSSLFLLKVKKLSDSVHDFGQLAVLRNLLLLHATSVKNEKLNQGRTFRCCGNKAGYETTMPQEREDFLSAHM